MKACIYLDRYQCEHLDVSYFEGCSASLRADEILSSKLQGYDRKHREVLVPLGSQQIMVTRQRVDSPGWYMLQENK